jgi:hypothetical protein
MENIPIDVLHGLFSNDKIPNDFIFEMFGEGIITNIEKVDNENKRLNKIILQLEKKLKDAEEVIHFFQNRKEQVIFDVEDTEDIILSKTYIDTVATPREVFDRNYYINELIRIEKKIAFYDIRQHFVGIDLKNANIFSNQAIQMPRDTTRNYLDEPDNYNERIYMSRYPLIQEYLTRINNIDISIFKKISSELPIYTKGYSNPISYVDGICTMEPINIVDFRNDNIGYIIDKSFIEELLSDVFNGYNCDDDTLSRITKYSIRYAVQLLPSHRDYKYHIDRINLIKNFDHIAFRTMCEIKLTEMAYELHNIFYKKIKEVYKKIEDKYNSIPEDFDDFDKLMNEVRDNEIEIDMLEEFDYKRRKLQIREFKLRGVVVI